jgi:excisionase family DNA binding protein
MAKLSASTLGKRRTPLSTHAPAKKSTSSMAERRLIADDTLDIFAVLRSRRTAWRAPELAILTNVDKRTIYKAVAVGQLPAIHIGTSLRINPADALAWVEAGMTGLRSSYKEVA